MTRTRALLAVVALVWAATAVARALPLPVTHVSDEQTRSGLAPLAGDTIVDAGGTLRFSGAEIIAADASITVASGGRLELIPGPDPITSATRATTIRAIAGSLRLVVDPGGSLVGAGSSITGTSLTSRGTTEMAGTDLDLAGGSFTIDGGTTHLDGGAVRNGVAELITVLSGALEADGTTFTLAGGVGIAGRSGSSIVLRDIHMSSVPSYGVSVEKADLVVEDSTFESTGDYAIQTVGSAVTLDGNTFRSHCGAYIGQGGSGTATNNVFETSNGGLSIYAGTTFTVRGNRFAGADHGLTIVDATVAAEENRFESNRVGVWVINASPTLERNRFDSNEEGVDVLGSPSSLVLRDNAFDTAGSFALRNSTTGVADARWNWWLGEPNTPGAGVVVGSALVLPWLTSPPAGV